MDDCPRQNPAYRLAKEKPRFGGAFLSGAPQGPDPGDPDPVAGPARVGALGSGGAEDREEAGAAATVGADPPASQAQRDAAHRVAAPVRAQRGGGEGEAGAATDAGARRADRQPDPW